MPTTNAIYIQILFFLFRAVFFSQILIKAVMAKRVRCTVLYATETGKSLTFAKKLNTMLSRAFDSRVRNAVFEKGFQILYYLQCSIIHRVFCPCVSCEWTLICVNCNNAPREAHIESSDGLFEQRAHEWLMRWVAGQRLVARQCESSCLNQSRAVSDALGQVSRLSALSTLSTNPVGIQPYSD